MRACCDDLFRELLQVAVGMREDLSHVPTDAEWQELFLMSKKQSLAGITFVAIGRLAEKKLTINLPETLRLQWLGLTANIANRNKELNAACAALCKDLAHDGLYPCILKGQSNRVNYPDDLRDYRTPGDIDVWCVAEDGTGKRGVIEWVLADHRNKGMEKPEVQYHHVDWNYKGIECEVHFRPSWMNNPVHNARLQKWCRLQFESGCVLTCVQGFNVPTVSFNAVYQLVHIYRHLFNEGIGLRQLLDYYYVLHTLSRDEREDLLSVIDELGMREFAGAVMWVLQKVFLMPQEYLLCAPDKIRGEFLLNEIMIAGNFGKYDPRNIITANEGYLKRFIRRQKRFVRFLTQYPSEVIWGPYFTVMQRVWRNFR